MTRERTGGSSVIAKLAWNAWIEFQGICYRLNIYKKVRRLSVEKH
jgi:hypothetical protein